MSTDPTLTLPWAKGGASSSKDGVVGKQDSQGVTGRDLPSQPCVSYAQDWRPARQRNQPRSVLGPEGGWILSIAASRQAAGNLQAKPGPLCRRLPAGSTPGCLTSPESSEYRDLLTLRPFEMKIWEAGSAGGRQACESFPGNRA